MPTAKWNNQQLRFSFTSDSEPLGAIRSLIADHFSLPPSSFRMIHAGAVMKDDTLPISTYKIRQNSTIGVLVASPESVSKKQPLTTSEQSTISQIQAEISSFRQDLSPSVTQFLAQVETTRESLSVPQRQEYTKLGELMLQRLLRLDAIPADGEWDTARKERKTAIKEIQSLLDRLDSVWNAQR